MGASTFKVCDFCEAWIKLPEEQRARPPLLPAAVAKAVLHRVDSSRGAASNVDLSTLEPLFSACMVVNQKLCPGKCAHQSTCLNVL